MTSNFVSLADTKICRTKEEICCLMVKFKKSWTASIFLSSYVPVYSKISHETGVYDINFKWRKQIWRIAASVLIKAVSNILEAKFQNDKFYSMKILFLILITILMNGQNISKFLSHNAKTRTISVMFRYFLGPI